MINAALQSIFESCHLAAPPVDRVRFVGADPVFPTPFRVGTAGAAALGALGLAVTSLREPRDHHRPGVEVDVRAAAASLRSINYVQFNGKRAREPLGPIHGFYPVAGGRWIYAHCNQPLHLAALLRVLGVRGERARVAEALSHCNAFDLEQAVDVEGGCAPVVRTPDEWRALANTAALATEPLIEIRKIGESAPIAPTGADRPLSGVRVLDLTRVLAGPTSARLFAEYGADVLKITCERYPDLGYMELDTGYGKRTATLDIATPADRNTFESLIRNCDVFCQAYRLEAMARLGFSQERVAALRPGIIYASLNAFGFSGSWRGRRGFDTVVQSASGMAYLSGDGNEPRLMPVSSLDYVTGYLLGFGVIVALKRRAEEGGSYCVNVSLARTREWIVEMGTIDREQIRATPAELTPDELAHWLIDVPTPCGRITRLRPLIRFSDGAFQDLPIWHLADHAGATWSV